MLGSHSYEITGEDFVRGMSSSDDLSDGGFSPLSTGINIIGRPGIVCAASTLTDESTADITDDLIASCEDAEVLGYQRVFMSANGRFFSWDGSTLTHRRTDGTNPGEYVIGQCDMAAYGASGEIYATNRKCIVRWDEGAGTFNVTFATFTNQTVSHPVINFENNLFYGDKNLLLRQTAAGSAPATIITLPAEQTITALGIDPGSGLLLIATTEGLNYSGTIEYINRVHYYDGFSNKTRKSIIVDDMVTAFKPVGGVVYVTYGANLGYWTGSGLQFLRKLSITLAGASLAYKHHLANVGRTLYVIEGRKLLAYGDTINGVRAFFYLLENGLGASGEYKMVCGLGNGKLGLGFATNKFYTIDTTSVTTVNQSGGMYFVTNRKEFPRDVMFKCARIYFRAGLGSVSDTTGTLALYDSNNTSNSLGSIVNPAGQAYWDFFNPTIRTRAIQLMFTLSPSTNTNIADIERIVVYYSPAE